MHSPVYLKPQCQIVHCVDDNQDLPECEEAFLIISSPLTNRRSEDKS
jgi:hypothetical protein